MAGIAATSSWPTGSCPRPERLGPHAACPSPEHVPTDDPEPVVPWLRETVGADGRRRRSSATPARSRPPPAGRVDHGDRPHRASSPTRPASRSRPGKLAAMRAAGMRAVPELRLRARGRVAIACDRCARRGVPPLGPRGRASSPGAASRGDGTEVDAFLLDQPRPRGAPGAGQRRERRLRRRPPRTSTARAARPARACAPGAPTSGASARWWPPASASTARPSTAWPRWPCPPGSAAAPATTSSSRRRAPSGTVVSLRIAPRLGDVDDDDAARRSSATSSRPPRTASSPTRVWAAGDGLRVVRAPAASHQGRQDPVLRTTSPPRLTPGRGTWSSHDPVPVPPRLPPAVHRLDPARLRHRGSSRLRRRRRLVVLDLHLGRHRPRGGRRHDDHDVVEPDAAHGHDAVPALPHLHRRRHPVAGGFQESTASTSTSSSPRAPPRPSSNWRPATSPWSDNAPLAIVRADSLTRARDFVTIATHQPGDRSTRWCRPRRATSPRWPTSSGKTVGFPTLAGNAEQTLDLLLKGAGPRPASVKRVAVGNDAAALGLRRGRAGST